MLVLACLNNIAIYKIWSILELHSTISRMQCSLHMVCFVNFFITDMQISHFQHRTYLFKIP